jgi:hypothetical protein
MQMPDVRERLITKIDELTDEQVASLLSYAESLQAVELPDDYDEENDPSIGFLSGPTDLANRAKQILREEITPLSGWTQKKD